MNQTVPEDVHTTELISYPGPWAFQLPRAGIILVTDEELVDLATDPDKVLNLATGFSPRNQSLRQVCEHASQRGAQTLILAFDHFFHQYRPGMDTPRELTPDMDEYVQLIASVSRFVNGYGLRLELSLLSPLEIGPAYAAATGESGRWLHYRKGLREPSTGRFSVQLWQHQRWVNNKGPIDLQREGVRVFAFREGKVAHSPYRVVHPDSIVELTESVETEMFDGIRAGELGCRVRVHGRGNTDAGPLDRVLVVQQYRCPEMDYFSDSALPYLTGLIDKYVDAGIELNGLYSDEMHIQQGWEYFSHHDHGQFAVRYVSEGLEKAFANRYGQEYGDLAKYMLYFTYAQEDFAVDLSAGEGVMHAFGHTPEEIHQTALFRSRYYSLLQDGVVDLFVAAKRHAEAQFGYRLESRAHATWAESPTIDSWRTGTESMNSRKYEYTSSFQWSNTVHQAASACHDYFKWGEFLTGTGNDHPEGGWLDRNYYGLALACSTGVVNEVPYSYCAHWGHPGEVSWRRNQLQNAFGVGGCAGVFSLVQGMQHRDVDVLMLYPLDLVSVEERFGSWTTQYGYANLITTAKLLELGSVRDGKIEVAGRQFSTLVVTFEPFPSPELMELIEVFTKSGGCLIWAGPPPLLDALGQKALDAWQELLGVTYMPEPGGFGRLAAGHLVRFEGQLAHVTPQIILTDFLVDRLYPVHPVRGTEVIARCDNHVVGTRLSNANGGQSVFLGYRPRDDQAASLGYETRNWFELLCGLGAYPQITLSACTSDNTEVISRTTDFLACRFPNGAVAIAPHLSRLEECWPGGFARDHDEDAKVEQSLELPDRCISLRAFLVNGHQVDYDGAGAVAFRVDSAKQLIAFAGHESNAITVDGRTFTFADRSVSQIGWGPVPAQRQVPGGASIMAYCAEAATMRIPAGAYPGVFTFYAEGAAPGEKGQEVACRREQDELVFDVTPEVTSRWLFGVPVSIQE